MPDRSRHSPRPDANYAWTCIRELDDLDAHSEPSAWRGYLITLLTVAVVLRKPWNPLWLFAGGALAGILGFV